MLDNWDSGLLGTKPHLPFCPIYPTSTVIVFLLLFGIVDDWWFFFSIFLTIGHEVGDSVVGNLVVNKD